ncbi:MAG: tryptophan synthase subunit beta [Thermaerobacter sp.]|nr:tryptophan synthase subunit beta [Thermaerobacter sp.]
MSGRFGAYGGQFVPETLMAALQELETAYREAMADRAFVDAYEALLREYVGRPTPLTHARRLTERWGGAQVYLKREDLAHTGAHKINNTLGQALLCQRMGKRRLIAETGAGQHGVAAATAAALLGLECEVFMGSVDVKRQAPNVYRMELLGTRVQAVESGSRTLKDATNAALREWVHSVRDTHYAIGSVVGPHPFPTIVRDLQSVIGREVLHQSEAAFGGLPQAAVACVGGGSNAAGLFAPLVPTGVSLYGVEAAGAGLDGDEHAATLTRGRPGVLHGAYSYLLQDGEGQVQEAYSISAGLDYPGVGPEHAYWHDSGRVRYLSATDEEALEALHLLARSEGIIPALESAHALARAGEIARALPKDAALVVVVSGRGDKDLESIREREASA